MNAKLRRAFLATAYEAAGIVVRVGQRSTALDRTLTGPAAFVTAWNPLSRRMPPGWNARMQRRLRALAPAILAEGFGRGRGWAEAHLLVAADPRRIAVLARRFRQHAVVLVAPRRAARLLILRR